MDGPLPIGLILAGGRGSRLGGRDKAWLRLHGQPLLCHAWRRLAGQVETVVVASQRHRWAYRHLGIELIDDHASAPGRGPLAGIAAALERWPQSQIAIMPVDAPLAPDDFVARLRRALATGAPAAAVFDGRRRQPLFALLSGQLAGAAVAALNAPRLPSMQGWLDQVGATWVDLARRRGRHEREADAGDNAGHGAGPDVASAFANINTPADLARATRILMEHPDG